jgi:hypothetical protein
VKAQFFIFNIFRQIWGILIINISVIIISIFSMMMQWFSLIDAIKWSLFFDFIAIILQFLSYKNSKKDIDPELLFSHYYILKMNPKSYCIRGNNIFFY